MQLLDIITPVRDTVHKVANDTVRLAADIAPRPPRPHDISDDHLLWTILAVLLALSLCFSLMLIYRRRNQPK